MYKTMKPYIEQTIADLNQLISKLTQTRDDLQTVFAAQEAEQIETPPASAREEPVAPPPKKLKRAPKCTTREMVEEMAAKLHPPITARAIADKTGCKMSMAANVITKWAAKKWLRKVGYGAYEKTEQFPGAAASTKTPAPTKPVAAKPAEDTSELREGSIEREIYFAAKHAPKEFTAASLSVSTNRTADAVALAIMRLEKSGWIKKAGVEDGEPYYKIAK
jgi:hypothetical protein